MILPFWYIIYCLTVTVVIVVTSYCFSFTKSKNKKKNRRIEKKIKKDLNKKRETKKQVYYLWFWHHLFSKATPVTTFETCEILTT